MFTTAAQLFPVSCRVPECRLEAWTASDGGGNPGLDLHTDGFND